MPVTRKNAARVVVIRELTHAAALGREETVY